MKRNILLAAALVFLSGCTSTTVTSPTFTLKRVSLLQRLEMADVSLSTNGTATLKGYKTDGGNEAATAIVGAAVSAAVSAAK